MWVLCARGVRAEMIRRAFERRKTEKKPRPTYKRICPVCGKKFMGAKMSVYCSRACSATQNYQWLWFDVKEDYKTLQYDHPYKQNLIGKDGSNGTTIIGITCAVAKNATPAADDIFGTYNVIYQANPGKKNDVGGFMLTKK